MKRRLYPEIIRQHLENKLPGETAQLKMAPALRGDLPFRSDCREASVLILCYPEADDTRIVFMKRNEYPGPHSGQISFPGGMHEENDRDLLDTALRENEEETGVPSEQIEVLGKLTPLYIPVSNFCVNPFVGWIEFIPEFKPDRSEVQYLITPSVTEIMDRNNLRTQQFTGNGRKFDAPCLQIGREVIWGATAMILSEFMVIIERMP